MRNLGRLLLAALIAGGLSGILGSIVHQIATVPVILAAEVFESGDGEAEPAIAAAQDHAHDGGVWAPQDGLERTLYTSAADILTGIGFALVLVAYYQLWGRALNWRTGLYWGLAGFAAVIVAPSLGLPFEVPGTEAAPLLPRQIWWIATVLATGGGLAMVILGRKAAWCIFGLAVIIAPHAIGAPQPAEYGGVAPEAVAHRFIVAATIASLVFWAALGATTGIFYKRLMQPGT